jgi:hypothetical protein
LLHFFVISHITEIHVDQPNFLLRRIVQFHLLVREWVWPWSAVDHFVGKKFGVQT